LNDKGDSQNNDGELDDLISAIKTGKAFFNSGFQPQRRQRADVVKSSTLEKSELSPLK